MAMAMAEAIGHGDSHGHGGPPPHSWPETSKTHQGCIFKNKKLIFADLSKELGLKSVKNGFSKKKAAQIRGRNRNPSLGGSCRDHFPFLGRIPKLDAKVNVYAFAVSSICVYEGRRAWTAQS